MIQNNYINIKRITISCIILFILIIIIYKMKNTFDVEEITSDEELSIIQNSYILRKYHFITPVSFFNTDFWYLHPISVQNMDEDQIILRGFLQLDTHLIYNSDYNWIGYFNDENELTLKEDMSPIEIQLIDLWFQLCRELTSTEITLLQQQQQQQQQQQ